MRKWWWWALQAVVAVVVGALIYREIVRHWAEFRSLTIEITPRPGWLLLSVLVVFVSYVFSVEAWRRILAGWSQYIPYGRAARTWLVANLGRYIPGKIWSVAGLVVLAQRAGVAPWAAAASAVAIQAIAIGTAVVVVAAATPGAEAPLLLAAAALIAVATIAMLSWDRSVKAIAKVIGSKGPIERLPVRSVAESSALGVLAWIAHGIAFWLLARGLGLEGTLSMVTAAGVFPLGYVLGLLALFAPGGVGVREVVLIGLLAQDLGPGGAVALSIASRILLTLTEVVAPLLMLLFTRESKENLSAT